MTVAWHHIQWSAPPPSFLRAAAQGHPEHQSLSLQGFSFDTQLHLLSSLLFSLLVGISMRSRLLIDQHQEYSTVFSFPAHYNYSFLFLFATPLFSQTLMQIPFCQLKDFHRLQWVFLNPKLYQVLSTVTQLV